MHGKITFSVANSLPVARRVSVIGEWEFCRSLVGEAMGIDLGQMHGRIVGELARQRPVSEVMAALIDQCEAALPHPDWARFRVLWYADLSPLLTWIQEPFRKEPPGSPLRSRAGRSWYASVVPAIGK
jgi:hypothetical protein